MVAPLTLSIGGSAVTFNEDSFAIAKKVNERQRLQCTVLDYAGTLVLQYGMQVIATDSVQGVIFSGYLIDDKQNKPSYPDPLIEHQIDTIDGRYLADKRTTSRQYTTPVNTGKIVVDLWNDALKGEGLNANAGLHFDSTQADFTTGTLSGVTSALNVGDGDLELTPAGTQIVVSGGGGGFPLGNGLKFVGYASSGYSTAYVYRQIWTGSITIASNDYITFDVWISSDSPAITASVDLVCSDGTTLRDSTNTDQQGMSMHPKTDLSGLANDTWYSRLTFFTGGFVGKTITSVQLGIAGTNAGTYTAYFRRIIYNISAGGTTTIFGDASTLVTNNQTLNNGYTNVSLTQVQLEDKSRVSVRSPFSIDAAKIVQNSQLTYSSLIPSGCTGIAETSIDNQASWQTHTSGNAIPNLLPGMVAAGRSVYLRFVFSVGKDPTVAMGFGAPTLIVNSAYNATKSDVIASYTTATDFSTGILTNLKTVGSTTTPAITLNGFQRNWDDANISNQTTFGSGSTSIINKQQLLTANASTSMSLRLDFAGQWQNFTAEVDITVPNNSTTSQGSLTYRTTGWQNNNDTYAYVAAVSQTQIQLGRGTNSSSGAGAFTNILAVPLSLAANSVHRLKVVANGSNHQIYLDGVLYISVTDATYAAAGYIGLRAYNSTTGTATVPFDNFGVVAALSGTWQSPSISLTGAANYGNSVVQWDMDGLPDSTTTITAQTSINGGSTWQSATNGGAISGLTAGQALSGINLLLKLTLTASNAPIVPVLNGVTAWVLGQYSSAGTRSTAPLGWDSMIRGNVVGGFGTATNGATYTKTGTGTVALTSNEALISNTTGDVHMQLPGVGADEESTLRFQLSASTISAGIELRYVDANNLYRLSTTTTTIGIIKKGVGLTMTLASASVALSTGTYYRMRFRVSGSGPVTLQGRVWLDQTLEPTTWNVNTTD